MTALHRRTLLSWLTAAPLAPLLPAAAPVVPMMTAEQITAGAITSVTILNAGSGYTSSPLIMFR